MSAIGKLRAIYALQLIGIDSPLKFFSWRRVKIALLNLEKFSNAYYIKETLVLNFAFHKHSVHLNTDGSGELINNLNKKVKKYKLIMPKEIQKLVKEAWDIHKTPIPVNWKLN